jgi:hypothetical protein
MKKNTGHKVIIITLVQTKINIIKWQVIIDKSDRNWHQLYKKNSTIKVLINNIHPISQYLEIFYQVQ